MHLCTLYTGVENLIGSIQIFQCHTGIPEAAGYSQIQSWWSYSGHTDRQTRTLTGVLLRSFEPPTSFGGKYAVKGQTFLLSL